MNHSLLLLFSLLLLSSSCKNNTETQVVDETTNDQENTISKDAVTPEKASITYSDNETKTNNQERITENNSSSNLNASKSVHSTSSSMVEEAQKSFAINYASAWSSQDASKVASFYAADGSLVVNGKEPAIGTRAITKVAQGFMTTFPDMVVTMDNLENIDDQLKFHWTLSGTNAGKQGKGNFVKIKGYEIWTLNKEGKIQLSDGHFDAKEYQRQLLGKK